MIYKLFVYYMVYNFYVFEDYEYNIVFNSQRNKSWCIRFSVDNNREIEVQSLLEKFNV